MVFIPDIFICVFYIFGDGVQFPGEVDILVNLPSECESIPWKFCSSHGVDQTSVSQALHILPGNLPVHLKQKKTGLDFVTNIQIYKHTNILTYIHIYIYIYLYVYMYI